MRTVSLRCADCIVELHCEIASRDCIVLHRGIALCNLHYADSILRIPSCSIVQTPSCPFHPTPSCHSILLHRADSIVRIPSHGFRPAHPILLQYADSVLRIPSCTFHRSHSIFHRRADSTVGSYCGIECGLYHADCTVRIASYREIASWDCIVRTEIALQNAL